MKKLMYIAGAAVAAMAAMAAVPNEAAAAVVTGGFTFVPNGQPTFNNGASTNIVAGITHKEYPGGTIVNSAGTGIFSAVTTVTLTNGAFEIAAPVNFDIITN